MQHAMLNAPKPAGAAVEGTVKSYNDLHGYGLGPRNTRFRSFGGSKYAEKHAKSRRKACETRFIASPELTRDAQFKTGELTMDLQAGGMHIYIILSI